MKLLPTKLARLPLSAWMFGGGLVLAVILLIATSNWQRVQNLLIAMKMLPQPETYTELYFNQHLQLPTSAAAEPLSFSFTVRNVEGQLTNYPFVVVVQAPGGQPQVISGGYVAVASGQSRSVPESIVLPKGMKTAEVSVVLTEQKESIHFLVGAPS